MEIIEKASFDGADTVRRVQEFSRKKDEDHNVNFVNVDLNEVINHTLEFTKVKWHDDAAAKDVKISIEKELSPCFPLWQGVHRNCGKYSLTSLTMRLMPCPAEVR